MLKWEHLIIIDLKNSFPQFSRLLPNEEMTKSCCQLGGLLAVTCRMASTWVWAHQGPAVCAGGLFGSLALIVDKAESSDLPFHLQDGGFKLVVD